MKIYFRPSFYFAVVPILGLAIAALIWYFACRTGCETFEATSFGRVVVAITHLFGYGMPMFLSISVISFLIESVVLWIRSRDKYWKS